MATIVLGEPYVSKYRDAIFAAENAIFNYIKSKYGSEASFASHMMPELIREFETIEKTGIKTENGGEIDLYTMILHDKGDVASSEVRDAESTAISAQVKNLGNALDQALGLKEKEAQKEKERLYPILTQIIRKTNDGFAATAYSVFSELKSGLSDLFTGDLTLATKLHSESLTLIKVTLLTDLYWFIKQGTEKHQAYKNNNSKLTPAEKKARTDLSPSASIPYLAYVYDLLNKTLSNNIGAKPGEAQKVIQPLVNITVEACLKSVDSGSSIPHPLVISFVKNLAYKEGAKTSIEVMKNDMSKYLKGQFRSWADSLQTKVSNMATDCKETVKDLKSIFFDESYEGSNKINNDLNRAKRLLAKRVKFLLSKITKSHTLYHSNRTSYAFNEIQGLYCVVLYAKRSCRLLFEAGEAGDKAFKNDDLGKIFIAWMDKFTYRQEKVRDKLKEGVYLPENLTLSPDRKTLVVEQAERERSDSVRSNASSDGNGSVVGSPPSTPQGKSPISASGSPSKSSWLFGW